MIFTSSTARGRSKRAIGLLAVAAMSLVACSNSSDGDSKETTTSAESTETTGGSTDTTEAPADDELGSFEPISGVAGVTDTDITYAVLGTGPSNPMGYCLLECLHGGVQAYFDYRNSLGGVHGRELKAVAVDDELGLNQVKALEIKDSSDYFGVFIGAVINSGMADLADTDIPVYTTYPSAADADGHENIYLPTAVLCVTCKSPLTSMAAKLLGGTKVGVLGLGVAQASKDCASRAEAEINMYTADTGIEVVYLNSDLPYGFTNGVGPEVTAMKDLGVDYILTCVDQNSVLVLEQELERQGMSDVPVTLPQGYGDTGFLETNKSILEGSLLGSNGLPFEATGEGTDLAVMKEWLGKSGVLVNDYAIQGWILADLAVAGLLAAGPQFDRAKAVSGTNSLTAFNAHGLIRPVDWSTAHNAPVQDVTEYTECRTYLVIKDAKPQLIGDPDKPYYCATLPMPTWVEPVQTGPLD